MDKRVTFFPWKSETEIVNLKMYYNVHREIIIMYHI